jgi:DNA polymerase III alpha subunit
MDIDIDFVDREKALSLFNFISASRLEDQKLVKHNTGVYLHSVPVDPITGLCQIPYEQAEEQSFFKIDFLNVGLYKGIRDENHLIYLMNQGPLWDLLEQDDFVNLLFHINGHGDILRKTKPKSVEELAAVLAMIRPAKRHLIGKSWDEINQEVWVKPNTGEYYFKKSHSMAYAMAIVIQMNLICEQISYGFS